MRYEANFVKVKQMNKMRVLVVDFYDSFVFNLVHYFEAQGCQVEVRSDHEIPTAALNFLLDFNGIILSPGPGLPQETHAMQAIISFCKERIPVFGVCLGMQGLGLDMGGTLYNLEAIRHGITGSLTCLRYDLLLQNLPNQLQVGLYHSWAVKDLDPSVISAMDEDGVIMAVENHETKQYGVQFHPESIMTPCGMEIVGNVISKIF
jgi:anthranilate synthase component 2